MSEISIEYYKKTNIEISDELLYLLLERYRNLSKYNQNKIVSDYAEFEKILTLTKTFLKSNRYGDVHNPVTLSHKWEFRASTTPFMTPMARIRPR